MTTQNISVLPTPVVDALDLARRCRAAARQSFPAKTSCIETTEIFARAAELLGVRATRRVCQVEAFSPKLAEQIKTDTVDKQSIGQPGIWAVGVGIPQYPGDFVGMVDDVNNRFVGHVVCLADDHLVDPSVDQMSRPERDMPLADPVLFRLDDKMVAAQVGWTETQHGVLLKYVLHPDVPAPRAKRWKIIERLARAVVRELTPKK